MTHDLTEIFLQQANTHHHLTWSTALKRDTQKREQIEKCN
jgi:hypothetical protein